MRRDKKKSRMGSEFSEELKDKVGKRQGSMLSPFPVILFHSCPFLSPNSQEAVLHELLNACVLALMSETIVEVSLMFGR